MNPMRLLGVCAAAMLVLSSQALAQSHPEYVPLGRLNAALYRPDTGSAPHIAFLIAHRTGNNLNNNACHELSKRGFMAVCFNTRFVNNETIVNWEETPLDVKAAVEFAKRQPGITKVILLGHSGGGPLMAFYQAVAENGPAYCQGPNKLSQCRDDLRGLPPADGMLFAESHPGDGAQALRGINPSLKIADGKVEVDSSLDPFDPKNGFNPNGPSHYAPEFRTRYYAAQSKVMNAQIAAVQEHFARMTKGDYPYPDNDIVLVPFSDQEGAARLDQMDPSIPEIMHTAKPRKLLKNDGSVVTEVIKSVEPAHPGQAKLNRTFNAGTKVQTLTSYLSVNAIRSANSQDGIDHCSTNNSTVCAVAAIRAPTLITAMGGYHLLRDEELMFEKSAAADKDYIVIEGAALGYTPCTACETSPGQYGNSLANMFDYIRKWTNERF
jgi:hypothetical protein